MANSRRYGLRNDFAFQIGLMVLAFACAGSATQGQVKPTAGNKVTNNIEWETYAETTNYEKTPRYAETIEYSKRLAGASKSVRFESFGKSGEGRDLPLLVVATNNDFDPASARRHGKSIVLVQACIHAGESDGKDAGLALIRDYAILNRNPGLMDKTVLLFIPIYNVDGHERFSPFNRINQNGPSEMGWRATSANLNLNRDYMKADAPETRAWLGLWNRWSPDLFIDCHVTDGADFQYNITYQFEHFANVARPIVDWEQSVFGGKVAQRTENLGNLVSTYLEFRDNRDLVKGINSFIGTPRFSTGYVALRNRPALLIETHMLKDYRSRVKGTYDMVLATLEEIQRDPGSLKAAIKKSEELSTALGSSNFDTHPYPLQLELTDKSVPHNLKAVESRTELSEVSGAQRVVFGSKPIDIVVPLYDEARATAGAVPPKFYIIPPQWRDVIAVLRLHGVHVRTLSTAQQIEVETYRFSDVKFASSSFEGRVQPTYNLTAFQATLAFPAGSIVVPVSQPDSRIVMNLLEPAAPDSFAAWGFFNAIFEQKEYGESYVLEKLARGMMAKDPALKKEFEDRVANDPKFRSDARARLNFFFERSPYWDRELNIYPVGRIRRVVELQLNPE